MALIKCVHCGTENDPEQTAGYCDQCGKKLPGNYSPIRSRPDFPQRPDATFPEDRPYESGSVPTNYDDIPFYRRSTVCSAIIIAHVFMMCCGGAIPLVSLLGIFTTLGVIAVCFIVLTGPVYYNQHRKDGTLKVWSAANKVAAVIILVLFVGGYGALIFWLISSGKIAH
jgi:hypothetical protein